MIYDLTWPEKNLLLKKHNKILFLYKEETYFFVDWLAVVLLLKRSYNMYYYI